MQKIQWKPLLISLAISLGTGVLASLMTSNSMEIYANLYKPPLAPPGWVFPVVWTILYILMGISAYLIYISDSEDKKVALTLYLVQLGSTVIWSLVFFRLNAFFLAFTWIIVLWYLIFLTYKQFKEINKTAAYLLIPYLVWVIFAGYLNLAIALHYGI